MRLARLGAIVAAACVLTGCWDVANLLVTTADVMANPPPADPPSADRNALVDGNTHWYWCLAPEVTRRDEATGMRIFTPARPFDNGARPCPEPARRISYAEFRRRGGR